MATGLINNSKRSGVRLIGVPREEGKEISVLKTKKKMAKNCPNLVKDTNLWIQEAMQNPKYDTWRMRKTKETKKPDTL